MRTTATTDARDRGMSPWHVVVAVSLALLVYAATYTWWRRSHAVDGSHLTLDDHDAVDVWLHRAYQPALALDEALTGMRVLWLSGLSPPPSRPTFDAHGRGP
ncbi:MAG TPA: hypothetical protein VEL07_10335 [Planctomycetota bacterium]|nr:hypothetical protein [Planctomycetota bacterium]